jgi:hypothetical protein
MYRRRISIVATLTFILSSLTGAVLASYGADMQPPPPLNMLVMGMCADQQYLYAVTAGKIVQYKLSDMTLVKTVDLPEPLPPSSNPPIDPGSGKTPHFPPPFARSNWLLVNAGSLYVMVGPVVYKYSLPDLSLQTAVDLPKPDLPPPVGQ